MTHESKKPAESPPPRPVPRRRRKTSPAVRVTNAAARVIITMGGIGTIIAVSLVCVFLISVVIPLFIPATVTPQTVHEAGKTNPAELVHLAVDEYQVMGYAYFRDRRRAAGRLVVRPA
jgi:ABC-type uncharacterized transport system permease subunit